MLVSVLGRVVSVLTILIFAILFLIVVLVVLVRLYYKEKKKEKETHYRENLDMLFEKITSESLSDDSSGEKTVSSDSGTEAEEKSGDKTGAVKYGRGFKKSEGRRERKSPKETEEFYRYSGEENDRLPCPGCGVENPQDGETCLLCGMSLH